MELLDRYLQAVKKHLPWKRQDDIIAELRANLEAQLEDKEAVLGRRLTTGEAEDWLRQLGAPRQVAARYQRQQYLIGPGVFPTYMFVLRMACFWATVGYLIASAVQIATQNPDSVAVSEALLRVPGVLMTAAAWVTLIFAAVEFTATHYPERCPAFAKASADWTPSTLPPLKNETEAGKRPRSYALAVAEVIFGFILLAWLLLVPQHPYLLLGPGALYLKISPFQPSPVLIQIFWWIIALNVLQLCWRCVDLIRGSWRGPRRAQHLAVKAFGLIPLALLLTVRDQGYFTLRHPEVNEVRYGTALASINHAIHLGLAVVCAIVVLQLVWDIVQVGLKAYRKREAAIQ